MTGKTKPEKTHQTFWQQIQSAELTEWGFWEGKSVLNKQRDKYNPSKVSIGCGWGSVWDSLSDAWCQEKGIRTVLWTPGAARNQIRFIL